MFLYILYAQVLYTTHYILYTMLLHCKYCNNVWDYKGDNPYYATCSRCLRKVKVVEFMSESDNNE